MKPLCYVIMPFGKKADNVGSIINFDSVYEKVISKSVLNAGLDPIRATEEMVGGIIHKIVYERLIFCECVIADISTENVNVFYELGVRHAVRPRGTVLTFAEGRTQLPYDVRPLRAIGYKLSTDGEPTENYSAKAMLINSLLQVQKEGTNDSPIFELIEGFPEIQQTNKDQFRERVRYSEEYKRKLEHARYEGLDTLRNFIKDNEIKNLEVGVLIEIFLSYRNLSKKKEDWEAMVSFCARMPSDLALTVMVQEQLALALNRAGRGNEAEKVLLKLIKNRGPSSETYGILGRVYQDRWVSALKSGNVHAATDFLDKAIDAYLRGFESDLRDDYLGLSAVMLMEIKNAPDSRRLDIIPVVKYLIGRKIASGNHDFWSHATKLELSVIIKDKKSAMVAMSDVLTSVRFSWELATVVHHLRLIGESRERRGEAVCWANKIEEVILKAENELRM